VLDRSASTFDQEERCAAQVVSREVESPALALKCSPRSGREGGS
jgi:hypothetical protein